MNTRRMRCSGSHVFQGRSYCSCQLLVIGKVRGRPRIGHCIQQCGSQLVTLIRASLADRQRKKAWLLWIQEKMGGDVDTVSTDNTSEFYYKGGAMHTWHVELREGLFCLFKIWDGNDPVERGYLTVRQREEIIAGAISFNRWERIGIQYTGKRVGPGQILCWSMDQFIHNQGQNSKQNDDL